jgi:hypothetical protein
MFSMLSWVVLRENESEGRSNKNIKICLFALFHAYALKHSIYWSEDFFVKPAGTELDIIVKMAVQCLYLRACVLTWPCQNFFLHGGIFIYHELSFFRHNCSSWDLVSCTWTMSQGKRSSKMMQCQDFALGKERMCGAHFTYVDIFLLDLKLNGSGLN